MNKIIKITPHNPTSIEYKYAHDLGAMIGTVKVVLRHCSIDEAGRRSMLRTLREIETGDTEYSRKCISDLNQLANELGFEFETN